MNKGVAGIILSTIVTNSIWISFLDLIKNRSMDVIVTLIAIFGCIFLIFWIVVETAKVIDE